MTDTMEIAASHTQPAETPPRVAVLTSGRFHSFHLARQLEKRGWLSGIYTPYPPFKLKNEDGIPQQKIHCHWKLYTALRAAERYGLPKRLARELDAGFRVLNDRWTAKRTRGADVVIGLSGSGLGAGEMVQRRGGHWICERGSTHILYQQRILQEEAKRVGIDPPFTPQLKIQRELAEYEKADRIVVPSRFVAQSFAAMGVPEDRIRLASYGANLNRFRPTGIPPSDEFVVLFVGQISMRKGIPLLLDAFAKIRHPKKRLRLIGVVLPSMKAWLAERRFEDVEFLGIVPNADLPAYYSGAHAFALPSVEEGLANAIGEALACGTPVVTTRESGAEDIMTDGIEGFILRERTSLDLTQRLQELADDSALRARMSRAALDRVARIGGWDSFGKQYEQIIFDVRNGAPPVFAPIGAAVQ